MAMIIIIIIIIIDSCIIINPKMQRCFAAGSCQRLKAL